MTATTEQREPDQIEGVAAPEFQDEVVGHAAVRAKLAAVLESGRLPGAILLHGPRGIGKATLAFALAREILTATGDEPASVVAAQVAAGAHPNLRVLRKAPRDTGKGYYTVIRVEEIRDTVERLRKTRGRAGHRVVVVDAIDDCNVSSANAMLKILEEPPAETLFLLVSHRPGQLLPTIRSRCHSVALRPLGDGDVAQVLAAGRSDVAAEARAAAVALAGGRPRRGFEALLLGAEGPLAELRSWLLKPHLPPVAAHLAMADAFAADRDGAAAGFARELVMGWIAARAREAAAGGPAARACLASATELWEKAHALFEEEDRYNLDARQTLVAVLDAIRKHAQQFAPTPEFQ